jgi:hypothetical protein
MDGVDPCLAIKSALREGAFEYIETLVLIDAIPLKSAYFTF